MSRAKHPIPDETSIKPMAILGITGSGKTFAAKTMVERWLDEERIVCVVDPTGAWSGLRSSSDGKHAGYSILILGGGHGDIPLAPTSGAAVAWLVAEQRVSVVCDVSLLTVGERTRWFTDFGRELFRLNRKPLQLVIDEIHIFAPQGKVPDPDTGKMLHAANQIASGGRSRGIRLLGISQRPAKVHKDTLTCANTLIAMRMIAPQDRKAVEDWILGCGDRDTGRSVLDSLAQLKVGEAWAWCPEIGFLERVKFPPIRTFDSSATPTDDDDRAEPKKTASVDLSEIRASMAKAVEEAEAHDPKALRAKLAQAQADLKKAQSAAPAASPEALAQAEARGRAEGARAWRGIVENMRKACIALNDARLSDIPGRLDTLRAEFDSLLTLMDGSGKQERSSIATQNVPMYGTSVHSERIGIKTPKSPELSTLHNQVVPEGVTRSELLCLSAFKWYELLGIDEPTSEQLAYKLGYSPTSSTMSVILSKLRRAGLVAGSRLTDAGRAAVPDPDLGTLAEFHNSIRSTLDGSARKVFDLMLSDPRREWGSVEICSGVVPPWSTESSTLSVAASALRRVGVMSKRGYQLTEAVFPKWLA